MEFTASLLLYLQIFSIICQEKSYRHHVLAVIDEQVSFTL